MLNATYLRHSLFYTATALAACSNANSSKLERIFDRDLTIVNHCQISNDGALQILRERMDYVTTSEMADLDGNTMVLLNNGETELILTFLPERAIDQSEVAQQIQQYDFYFSIRAFDLSIPWEEQEEVVNSDTNEIDEIFDC